jgi:hypothetical protein
VSPQSVLINIIPDKSGSMGPKQSDVIGASMASSRSNGRLPAGPG